MKPNCDHHENYIPAGYPVEKNGLRDVLIKSIYWVYCLNCNNFINLLTGENINDKGLVAYRPN